MAAPSAYTPPPSSLARDFVEAFFTLFVGAILQGFRFVRLLVLKARRSSARRGLFLKAVAMGTRMEQAGAGDQLLLQQIRASAGPKQRELVLARMGELGLETGVPLLGLEEDYQAGHDAYRRCRQAEQDHDEAAYKLVPHSALGWFAILISYVLTPLGALLVFGYFFPDRVPAQLARLVRGSPADSALKTLPEVRFDDVRVAVIGARIGRSDVAAGSGVVVVDETPSLFLRLRITNSSAATVDYQTWRGRFKAGEDVFARVNDDRGASLRRLVRRDDEPPVGGVLQAVIRPGESVEDVLVYGPPEAGYGRLDIFLPGNNVGAKGHTRQVTLTPDQVKTAEAAR